MSIETLKYQTAVRAIKDHRCNFCAEKILKGDTYHVSTHKYDGRVYDWKSHTYCSKLASDLKMYEDADEGVTEDMFQESIQSAYFDLMLSYFSSDDEVKKYSEVLQQLRHVKFRDKLFFVIRQLNKTQP